MRLGWSGVLRRATDFGGVVTTRRRLKTIRNVLVVDDSRTGREGASLTIADAKLCPIAAEGPLPDLAAFVEAAVNRADAVYCDHNLSVAKYATFRGAEAVAAFYRRRFPAVLCTQYSAADIDAIRVHLRYIPSLIPTSQVSPEGVTEGLRVCQEEFQNVFRPTRKPWRTLVRIEEVVETSGAQAMLYVVVPAWRSDEVIRVRADSFPGLGGVKAGIRFHAHVNLGAVTQEQLFFTGEERA